MAKFQFKKAETSVILLVFIQDASKSTGVGLSGLDENSSIVGGYCKRGGTGVALAVDEDVATEGTYQAPSSVAHVRIGTPVNMITGWYELHFHNDLFTTADYVGVGIAGAASMAPVNLEIQLTDVDLNGEYVNSNLVAVEGSATVDTLSITDMLTNLIASAQGDVARSSNVYAYKKQNGSTTAFTHTVSATGRV